jgi:hypothetical protein
MAAASASGTTKSMPLTEKCVNGEKRSSFISIDEQMIACDAAAAGCGHFWQLGHFVAPLISWATQCRFEKIGIAQAGGTAVNSQLFMRLAPFKRLGARASLATAVLPAP